MLRDTISQILGERNDQELAKAIHDTVLSFPDVQGAYDLVLNNYGPDTWNGSIHRTGGIPFPEYAQIDLAIACENLWLEVTAQGLGTVMLGIAPHEDRMVSVEKALDIPAGLKPFAIFPVVYPAEARDQQDRYDTDRIHYV